MRVPATEKPKHLNLLEVLVGRRGLLVQNWTSHDAHGAPANPGCRWALQRTIDEALGQRSKATLAVCSIDVFAIVDTRLRPRARYHNHPAQPLPV
jgi:hypothetical protein